MALKVAISANVERRAGVAPLLACALVALATGPANAQEVRDHGTTTRGLLRDRFELETAQSAVTRAGADCEVTHARLRGRDATGTQQFEVTCQDAPGYLVIGQPVFNAINCLTLSGAPGRPRDNRRTRSPRCELSENRNALPHYQRMAREAGIACRVDDGRFVGLTPDLREIYEVGCSGAEGAWIERSKSRGWGVKACMTVSAEGGECHYSDEGETVSSFADRLRNSQLSDCAPTRVRPMGSSPSGSFYEVVCADENHIVARFSPTEGLQAVIPCNDAASIGGGCRLR